MDNLLPVFLEVIDTVPVEFDAHDFILKLIQTKPYDYFALLHNTEESVSLTNARISSFLKNNASVLSIVFLGKHFSDDIYRNSSECACFRKDNK